MGLADVTTMRRAGLDDAQIGHIIATFMMHGASEERRRQEALLRGNPPPFLDGFDLGRELTEHYPPTRDG